MSPAPSAAASDGLPILSYAQLASPATRPAFLRQLATTLSTVGFFYLVDFEDAVPTQLYHSMDKAARSFWDLPVETRLLIDQTQSPHFRGYSTFKTETTFGKADLRDQIDLGPERPPHPLANTDPALTHPLYLNLQGPNQFLPEDVLPGFKATTLSYHTHLLALSQILLRAIAETLLPPSSPPFLIDSLAMDIFSPSPHARMKIVRYPCVAHGSHIDGDASSGEPTNGEMGVGAHADGGGLTILMQDQIGGLQVQRWDGTWTPAPPLPPSTPHFVCNIGQQLTHLSSGLYPSTTHRVLPNLHPSGLPRYSVPFFLSPDLEKRVVPIPRLVEGGGEAEVVSEVRKGDLVVQGEETYGVSSWRGTSRSHRRVMERWYPEVQREMDRVARKG